MIHYSKTQLGHDALKHRSMQLNARQRRLLVLIGTEDFDSMNEIFKQRLAPPELIEQLSEMGLIMASSAPSLTQHELIEQPVHAGISKTQSEQHTAHVAAQQQETIQSSEPAAQPVLLSQEQIIHSPQAVTEPVFEDIVALDFDDVKYLMAQLLQKYCGLMAKQLILRIQGSEDIRALKLCQMQWITQLQETRIPPKELNRILHQINFSLQKLNPA